MNLFCDLSFEISMIQAPIMLRQIGGPVILPWIIMKKCQRRETYIINKSNSCVKNIHHVCIITL